MTIGKVQAAYGARADEYIEAVGRIEHVANSDLALVREWALDCVGPLLDVGCGPGQWTHWLSEQGVQITGIDPVPEFIEQARAAYPGQSYSPGIADSLGVDAGLVGGVLAWYSLIHSDASGVEAALAAFARCVRPGGGLLLGFFACDTHEPFDHAVTTAWCWPVDLLASTVMESGLEVTHTATRAEPGMRGARTHGEIVAIRRVHP